MARRLLPLLLVLAAAPLASSQATAPDPAVATVNGEAIKASEYYRRLEWFHPPANSAYQDYPVGFQVLREMISDRMIVQLAQARGVLPTAPQIDARVAEAYRDDPQLKTQLAESGSSEAELRAQLATQEAKFNLVTAGVTITDQEVEKHYTDSPAEFKESARYKLRIIAVGDDDAQQKVDAALRANRPFPDVAKEFSLDAATKNIGGEYGDIPETALADATRRAIEVTPVGSTSVWVQGAGSQARVKFFVESVTPAKTIPLDAVLKSRIRRRMMLDKGSIRNNADVSKALDAATKAATVTIAQPQFQKYYAAILDRIKKGEG